MLWNKQERHPKTKQKQKPEKKNIGKRFKYVCITLKTLKDCENICNLTLSRTVSFLYLVMSKFTVIQPDSNLRLQVPSCSVAMPTVSHCLASPRAWAVVVD